MNRRGFFGALAGMAVTPFVSGRESMAIGLDLAKRPILTRVDFFNFLRDNQGDFWVVTLKEENTVQINYDFVKVYLNRIAKLEQGNARPARAPQVPWRD